MTQNEPSSNRMIQSPIDRTISVAPMMGATDRHFRKLARIISPNAFLFTEMVVSGALIYGNAANFLQHADDDPCALQIGGSNPDELARCAAMVQAAGYQEINLNVGCPSDRVQYGRIGACLMAEPELVAQCLSAMAKEVDIPVTIKCRIGINKEDSYEAFERFIQAQLAADVKIFYIHARSAILDGLSPKENREIPPLKYDYVSRIKTSYPEAQFFLNGGVKTNKEALALLPNFDGIMMGRAPYADPYMLAELEAALYQHESPTRLQALETYLEYVELRVAEGNHPKHCLKHLLGLFTGCPGARSFRRYLSQHMFEPDVPVSMVFDALKAAGLDKQ